MVTSKGILSRLTLGGQLLVALVIGALVGLLQPSWASFYQFLGQAFIALINMVIIPLVFPLVVVAVAGVISQASLGKLLTRTLLYFFSCNDLVDSNFYFC